MAAQQVVGGQRFEVEDVERHPAQKAGGEAPAQLGHVDQRRAGGVDQQGLRTEQGEPAGVDEPLVLRCGPQVKAHRIGGAEQGVQGQERDPGRAGGVLVQGR